jgi:hypothetical protein
VYLRKKKLKKPLESRSFSYDLPYKELDLRFRPELYRVGLGEQGVLTVEPYKSEILPHWRFRTPLEAGRSAREILKLFHLYRRQGDFVGMDMSRKFLQMGYTRSRRYANHRSGRKFDRSSGKILPFENDALKAESARIFYAAWKELEANPTYVKKKLMWKQRLG